MVALNCEVKCIQKPSRVPGWRHESPRLTRMRVNDIASPRMVRPAGASRTTSTSPIVTTRPSDAVSR